MKIICTKTEKENLIDCICSSQFCPFGNMLCVGINCEHCFPNNVEWDVKDIEWKVKDEQA